jgi:hypothetical protein
VRPGSRSKVWVLLVLTDEPYLRSFSPIAYSAAQTEAVPFVQ